IIIFYSFIITDFKGLSMSIIEIFILALIQGLTEFLPVSSSGHLVIMPYLLKWKDQGLDMDIALHLGTLLAVILYFRPLISQVIVDFFTYLSNKCEKKYFTNNVKLAFTLMIATLP